MEWLINLMMTPIDIRPLIVGGILFLFFVYGRAYQKHKDDRPTMRPPDRGGRRF